MNLLGEFGAADWKRPSVVALLLANLLPAVGVLFLGWEVFPLMFLFWSENVIIGAINVLKLLTCDPDSPAAWVGKLFLVPFFCIHYGMFTFVHGVFVIFIFGGGLGHTGDLPGPATFWHIMRVNHLGWAVLGLAVSRAISFSTNYIGGGEYKRANLQQLMSQPYARIIVLHLAVLGGGFLMMTLRSPTAGLLLLVALKIVFDLRGHLAERKKFVTVPVAQPA